MIDAQTWEGVQSLLDNYVELRSDDTVVLAYTSDSYESAAWVSAALLLRDMDVKRVWMAPIKDAGFPDRFISALPSPTDVPGRLIVMTFERDTMSHTAALRAALGPYDRGRSAVFRAISAGANLFSDTMRVSPQELSARNTAILERCLAARNLRIETPGGTALNVTLDVDRHRWISNRGAARPGGTVILPAGEVATFPASIAGVLVADFAFNINAITDRDARLNEHPITVLVEDGRAVKYECDDLDTQSFLDQCFQTYCAYNVGELGFGTNPRVEAAIRMNSHINERRPGVHIGFGQHNQDPNVVGYQCAIHLDLIARGGRVWFDDDPVALDLENVAPSAQSHPTRTRDEDVFSPEVDELEIDDCCGILAGDGLQLFPASLS